jgi:hypothetical protein
MAAKCPICQFDVPEGKVEEHVESAHKASTEPEIAEMRAQLSESPRFQCMVCHKPLPSPEAVREHHHVAHGL